MLQKTEHKSFLLSPVSSPFWQQGGKQLPWGCAVHHQQGWGCATVPSAKARFSSLYVSASMFCKIYTMSMMLG